MADYAFDEPGTFDWLCPDGWSFAAIDAVAGGGGGDGGDIPLGGGAGGGGERASGIVPVVAGVTYTVIVGLGGPGASFGDTDEGDNGGDSEFAGLVIAHGGRGAGGAVDHTQGGAGGSDGVGDSSTPGGDGSDGALGTGGDGGAGGAPIGGEGGSGGTAGSPTGQPGMAPGGGGGGGGPGLGGDGGDGADGWVLITRANPIRPAIRLYPRDDGRGMSSAPRIHPQPRGRSRIIGGFQ